MNYLLTNDKIHKEYVRHYTNAAYLVKEGYAFNEGLFSGYDEAKAHATIAAPGNTRSVRTALPSAT